MPHVLIIHDVESYPVWKLAFDKAARIRKAAGELSYRLLRHESDANRVVHFSAWNSLSSARSFFESAQLIRIREEAGVKAPEFLYLEQIEEGIL